MIEAARDALYAAGIGGGTLAARLLEYAAAGGAELVSERYRLCALLEASESGLRYALKTLAAAGLIECQRSARGLVRFAVKLGARMHVTDMTPLQRVMPFAETLAGLNHGEHGGHGVEEGRAVGAEAISPSVFSVPSVVKELMGHGVAMGGGAEAQRESAARKRDATEGVGDAPADLPPVGEKPRVSEVVAGEEVTAFKALWPHLLMDEPDTALAREVHSSIPIPPFPPPLAKARYSPGNREDAKVRKREGEETDGSFAVSRCRDPAGGNVDVHRAAGMAHAQGGKIAAWREQILKRVNIDDRYAWTAWSAALLAVEGPISEATLAGCIEGARGHGGKFVNAVKARLAECDVGKLRQLTLWDDVTRTVQLHRFTHLRPALARHGIQLDDRATRLVRTARRA